MKYKIAINSDKTYTGKLRSSLGLLVSTGGLSGPVTILSGGARTE